MPRDMSAGNQQISSTESGVSAADVAAQNQATAQGSQLFNLTEPGLSTAENFYSKIASGSPTAITAELAPALGPLESSYQTAENQIKETTAPGGAQQTALAELPAQKASDVSKLVSESYASSFPALANLGRTGVQLSLGETGQALSAGGQAVSASDVQFQQQAENKGMTMGLLSGLAGAGAEVASAGIMAGSSE